MDTKVIGISAALGSAASWAIGSILFQRIGQHISPLAMTLAKGTVSAIFLAAILFLTGFEGVPPDSLLLLILSGFLGISVGDTLFFEALQDIGAHTLVLLTTLGEVFTVLLAVIVLKETPPILAWFGIFLVVLGVTIVLYSKISGENQATGLKGICFGLLSVLCMSVSLIIARQGMMSISPLQATFVRMLSGTIGVLFFGLTTRRLDRWFVPFEDPRLVRLFLISVFFVTFGGFYLSLVAIKYVDVSIANTLNSTDPLFVLPLAAFFLKEKITQKAVVGTLITFCGIVAICWAA